MMHLTEDTQRQAGGDAALHRHDMVAAGCMRAKKPVSQRSSILLVYNFMFRSRT